MFTTSIAQVVCATSYEDGEFQYLLDSKSDAEFKRSLQDCGDTLFKFLMIELSPHEDCEDAQDAIRRVSIAIDQLYTVKLALADVPKTLNEGTKQCKSNDIQDQTCSRPDAHPTKQGEMILDEVGLTANELADKYGTDHSWGEHPAFNRRHWKNEVANGDTQIGYWQWVQSEIEQSQNDEITT